MKILVGYDYSTVTQDVLALAKQQAQAFNAEVHLLRSLERNPELNAIPSNRQNKIWTRSSESLPPWVWPVTPMSWSVPYRPEKISSNSPSKTASI